MKYSQNWNSMKKNKMKSYLGLARRAGKIVSGYQTCIHTLQKGEVKLILVAEDAAQNTKDKFIHLCDKYGVPFEIFSTADELSEMTGFPGRGVFGITDKGFAEVMMKEIRHDDINA